jgi:hypothetical protein
MSDDKDDRHTIEKGKLGAGATMQVNLDQVELLNLELAKSPAPPSAARKTPPPLPGMLPPTPGGGIESAADPAAVAAAPVPAAPPAPTSLAPAPAEPPSRMALHIGVIVVVVAVAVGAGLLVARAVRGTSTATTAPSAAEPSATHTAPVDSVLTIPPIEVR